MSLRVNPIKSGLTIRSKQPMRDFEIHAIANDWEKKMKYPGNGGMELEEIASIVETNIAKPNTK